jgi:hypothetical protein
VRDGVLGLFDLLLSYLSLIALRPNFCPEIPFFVMFSVCMIYLIILNILLGFWGFGRSGV